MKVYCGIDGDKVGEKIEALIITGQLIEASELSRKVKSAVREIERMVQESGGEVIFAGGDSIFAKIEFDEALCKNLIRIFEEITGCFASAGIGKTPTDAYLALKLAKSSGQGMIKAYGDLTKT